jgi:hypothetical protein
MLRKWQAFLQPEERDDKGEPKPTLRGSVTNLSKEIVAKDREIADLKAHITDLEAGRRAMSHRGY